MKVDPAVGLMRVTPGGWFDTGGGVIVIGPPPPPPHAGTSKAAKAKATERHPVHFIPVLLEGPRLRTGIREAARAGSFCPPERAGWHGAQT